MTVPSETNRSGPYNGNGSTTVFGYGFRIVDEDHLRVILTSALGVETILTIDVDYSVADVGDPAGGQITLSVAPSVGETITILRNIPFTQDTDLENQGAYYAETVEDALDLAAMRDQQLSEKVDRALKIPASSDPDTDLQLPAPEARKIIAWNEAANGLENLDPSELASVVSYGTANADIFIGDGATTVFALSDNPSALNNLDVSIGGVSQLPGEDYSWTGGVNVTFTSAPANGVKVLVRYMRALPQGATDVYNIQPFSIITGGRNFSIEDRLGRRLDLLDAGALSDNATDIKASFDRLAAHLVAAGGGVLRIPKGDFASLSDIASITVAGEENIKIVGEGRDQTYIRVGGAATRGIRFRSTSTTPNRLPRFDVSGLTIAASGEDVDWAVDAEWAINGDVEDPFFMQDVAIQQYLKSLADDGTDYGYFRRLVRVSNARNGNVKDFRFFGDMDRADAAKTEVAIQLDGECTSFRIENGYVLEAQKGVYTSAETEGLYCHNLDLIAVDTGVDFGSGSALEPQLTWQGGTIAAYETALNIQNCRYFRVADTFILCKSGVNGDQPSKNWTGVKVSGSLSGWGTIDAEFSKEHGQGSGGATSTAVDVVTGDGIEVRGSVHGFDASDPIDYGVRFRAGVTRSKADIQTRNVTTDYDYTPADGNTVIRRNAGEMQIMGGNDQYLSIIGQAAAWLKMVDLGGSANSKEARWLNDGGNIALYLMNDDGSVRKNPILVTSGGTPVIGDGAWNSMPLRLGNFHLWVDGTGDLRIKSSAPSSDTDGIVVGTQS